MVHVLYTVAVTFCRYMSSLSVHSCGHKYKSAALVYVGQYKVLLVVYVLCCYGNLYYACCYGNWHKINPISHGDILLAQSHTTAVFHSVDR